MIKLSDVHFRYRKMPVFSGLSLDLLPGHIYGLLGKNGTGKSTLLRCLAGLLAPQSGSIVMNGSVPFKRNPEFLSQIYLVPEEFYLPDITVEKYIRANSPFYPAFDHARVQQYLQEFAVPVGSSLQQMSYGQKKKVLISFALACNTRLLLMDEPTNGLDIISKSQFRKVIASAVSPEKCIIISTHQVRDLENMIDRIMIMEEGKILFDETIESIQEHLACKLSYDASEVNEAIYSEKTIHGHSVLTRNDGQEEGAVDLEMLYKATVLNGKAVHNAFKSNTIKPLI